MEQTKITFSTFYFIPWPFYQKIMAIVPEIDFDENFIVSEDGYFVDKKWFDDNRDNYGI